MKSTKPLVIRVAAFVVIAIALVSGFIMLSSNHRVSAVDGVELAEIIALIFPLLWIAERHRWAVVAASEFLIWFGFSSIQSWMKAEYLYSSGFALCFLICAGILATRLRSLHAAQSKHDVE